MRRCPGAAADAAVESGEALTYLAVDIVFSAALDTAFNPVDYFHRKYKQNDYDELCKTP